jgi:hypothetical protein
LDSGAGCAWRTVAEIKSRDKPSERIKLTPAGLKRGRRVRNGDISLDEKNCYERFILKDCPNTATRFGV